MKTYTTEDFKTWGAQGGAKSKRTLTREQSLAMLRSRKNNRRMKRAKAKAYTTRGTPRFAKHTTT